MTTRDRLVRLRFDTLGNRPVLARMSGGVGGRGIKTHFLTSSPPPLSHECMISHRILLAEGDVVQLMLLLSSVLFCSVLFTFVYVFQEISTLKGLDIPDQNRGTDRILF